MAWPLGSPALAFDGQAGEEIVIPAGQTVEDDLYLAGQRVTINGTVRGDVVAAAQILTVNGQIEGNLIAAAQTIILNGIVRDTARVAAQVFVMDGGGRVGHDVIVAGYSTEIRPGSTVGRDLGVGASQALIAGRIQRNVRGGIDGLEISGNVGGDVIASIPGRAQSLSTAIFEGKEPPGVTVPVVKPGLTVTDSARIDGRLRYESPQEYPIAGRVGQGVSWTPMAADVPTERGPVDVVLDIARKAIAIAVVGLLLMWLTPGGLTLIGNTIETRPAPSVGWGIVVACLAVVAIIGLGFGMVILALGFVTITLFSLAGLIFMLGVLSEATLVIGLVVITGLVAQAIISHKAGRMLLERVRPPVGQRDALPLFVGAILFAVVSAVPVLGGLLALAAAFATLGAAWLIVRGERAGRLITSPQDAGPTRAPAPAE
jgi:hypothetical protein